MSYGHELPILLDFSVHSLLIPYHAITPFTPSTKEERFEKERILDVRSLVLKHFSAHTSTAHPACVYKKGFVKGEALRLLRTNSSKAMFKENVRKFKTRLISIGCPKQKVGRKLSNKNWERTKQLHKKNLPFFTQFQPSLYVKLVKHTYEQMAFIRKLAVAQRDIQGTSLYLL